jgi:hypothetical protein
MGSRTIIEFVSEFDIWSLVDKWAEKFDCKLIVSSNTERLYQIKGRYDSEYPSMLNIKRVNQNIRLEVWIKVPFYWRIFVLFIIPSEMGIESGGVRLVLARQTARDAVNILLIQLKQPMIQ